MNIFEIQRKIADAENELRHLGSCTTFGKTPEQIAHIDERFFLACAKAEKLKNDLAKYKEELEA